MSIVEALERHRDTCRDCRPWSPCAAAGALLSQLAGRIAPMPPGVEVLDLDAHKESCLACRTRALCPAGRRIVAEAGTALVEAAGPGRRRMGRA